jgi:hypothetical protein
VRNDDRHPRRTAHLLASLPPGYVVLQDVRLSGRPWAIDHLVIGPTGVFTVGRLHGDADAVAHRDELARAGSEAYSLRSTLGVAVRPILCTDERSSRRGARTVDGVLVCDRRDLRRAITRSAVALPRRSVTRLAAAAGSVLVPAG